MDRYIHTYTTHTLHCDVEWVANTMLLQGSSHLINDWGSLTAVIPLVLLAGFLVFDQGLWHRAVWLCSLALLS